MHSQTNQKRQRVAHGRREDRVLAGGAKYIDFQTDPSRYRHWKLDVDGDVATLTMDVDENAGLFEGLSAQAQFLRSRRRHRTGRRACSGCASSIREVKVVVMRFGQEPRVLRRRQHPHAGGRRPTRTRSISANSPTRPATAWKIHRKIPGSVSSPSSTAPRPAAATSWRSRPITSSSPTTAPPPCRCRKCRCSRCCRAPAG